jgi:hypothetical protein
MKRILILIAGLLVTAAAALAHGTDKGPHGGARVDAGNYHVEAVAKETSLSVYLYDESNNPVDATGARATGIFVVDGKSLRIELKPAGANSLTGTSAVSLPVMLKGAVQVSLPGGKNLQAKF